MNGSDRNAIIAEAAAGATVKLSDALNKINELWENFDTQVVSTIETSWFNKNATKIMPDVQNALNKANDGINESVSSLGRALVKAVRIWEEGNGRGAGFYHTKDTVPNKINMAHQFKENDGGAEGMDVSAIQTAIDKAEDLKGQMLAEVKKIRDAANDPAFEGGQMQARLRDVSSQIESAINKGVDGLINDVTLNTGTAKKNVVTAREATESLFQIQ